MKKITKTVKSHCIIKNSVNLRRQLELLSILRVLSFGGKCKKFNFYYARNYCAEACSEGGVIFALNSWATQLRRNIAVLASRWQHCAQLLARESNYPAPVAMPYQYNLNCWWILGCLMLEVSVQKGRNGSIASKALLQSFSVLLFLRTILFWLKMKKW